MRARRLSAVVLSATLTMSMAACGDDDDPTTTATGGAQTGAPTTATGATSTCTGNCAVTWPPLVLAAGTTAPVAGPGVSLLTTSPRPDDATKLQVAWDNKPLYTYSGDTAAGETKGDGVGGTWHVAKAVY